MMKTLDRTFKAIKYAQKLDLRKLELVNQPMTRSMVIYFAKRMQHSQIVLIRDDKVKKLNFQGVTESWAKYARRADRFTYFLVMDAIAEVDKKKSFKTAWRVVDFLRYQPRLKDLTFSFACYRAHYEYEKSLIVQDLKVLQRCSKNIQRLSVQGIYFPNPIIDSLHRFSNLRGLQLEFSILCPANTITSFFQLLSQIGSHLQSLSVDFPEHPDIDMPSFESLTCLTKLKLKLKPTRGFSSLNFGENFPKERLKSFVSCPIKDFSLDATMSIRDLDTVRKFLKRFPDFEHLELKFSMKDFLFGRSDLMPKTEQILETIDDMALLRNVSVSLNTPDSDKELPEVGFLFEKLFKKPVPLESFEISIPSIKNSDYSFLEHLEAFKPAAANLKKLRIDIGDFGKDKKNEPETILKFIQSLENIQCLRLDSLKIPKTKFFLELVDVVEKMPHLRTLTLGKVSECVTKPKFLSLVERIMQKKGLEVFDCQVIKKFRNILEKKDEQNPLINIKKIMKKNPSLRKIPQICIYA